MAHENDSETPAMTTPNTARRWRSLGELEGSETFRAAAEREFLHPLPDGTGIDRRRFLQLMGASAAFGGAVGCTTQPLEKIVPYVKQPEELVPGRPLQFASAVPLGGYATGVLVESHEGRPTKLEGNPDHPASMGATTALDQATILDLYDPHRSQALKNLGRIRTWNQFVDAVMSAAGTQEASGGAGLRILTRTTTSPGLASQIERILERFPSARWYQYEPVGRQAARMGSARAFGDGVDFHFDLEPADVILCLDADLLTSGPAAVRYAKQFSRRRQPGATSGLNRLYAIESTPTNTGATADHRLALPTAQIEGFALALAARLGISGATAPDTLDHRAEGWLEAVAKDLERHPGRSLVTAGDASSPELHVLAHAINVQLGNAGATVRFTEPVEARPVDQIADISNLARELRSGKVEVLFILDANPVYDAPADLELGEALNSGSAWLRVHVGRTENETTPYCHWHVPSAHFLETWGDARAFDGTVTIQQPLIEPLYGGRSPSEVLAVLEGRPGVTSYDLIREQWVDALGGEKAWRQALHDGWVADSAAAVVTAELDPRAVGLAGKIINRRSAAAGMELVFRPDPTLYDGRFATNSWLQECPKPFTKLTWDNALLVSPRTARELAVETGDLVTVTADERSMELAVFVLPGQADGTLTLHLGHGRITAGVGSNVGFDAYPLRTGDNQWTVGGVSVVPTGERYPLATTQEHHSMENRHLVRAGTVAEYERHPHFAHELGHTPSADMTLLPGHPYDGYAWGMAINLSACTGCNACVVACQSENNIPVVGKEEVGNGREMHWIRVDGYFEGDPDHPEAIYRQPIPCMQCENAPCELVCPVAATVHSEEGLNDMVYNRCVGTRYCANNCVYKVRRFNFFKYQDWESPTLKMMRNPDVTVRFRGVMEKCTYCVQRINGARIAAHRDDQRIGDGDVVTACQQVCPSEAIAFGDINDPDSQVSAWKELDLNYGLLAELNTRPRTTYLARITNPNPELEQHP